MRPARAQPVRRTVGFLNSGSASDFALALAALREGLAETGHVDGRNVAFEFRWTEGQRDRIAQLADELVNRNVAVIVASFNREALAAKNATATIPIVFITASDPVNLITNLDQPEANVTGISEFNPALERERFELLRMIAPKADLIGVVIASDRGTPSLQVESVRSAARVTRQRIQIASVLEQNDIESSIASLIERGANALVMSGGSMFINHRQEIIALATRHAIPVMYDISEFTAAGGLISYGPSLGAAYRQAGVYAGKILGGAKPGDLPVLRQNKPKLAINLKTARSLGIEIPASIRSRADEVVE